VLGVVLVTVCCAVFVPAGAAQSAESRPETAEEFLSAFERLNGTQGFDTYAEFEIMRSQAVLDVQVGEFTDTEQRRMGLVLDTLESFRRTYRLQQNGSYMAAMAAANETAGYIDQLRTVQGGEAYAGLGNVALERFYSRTGQAVQSRAENESTTPARLATLERAAKAYEQAGNVDRYSQILVRVDSVRQRFAADLVELNESAAAAQAFYDGCTGCVNVGSALSTNAIGVLPQYRNAIDASQEAQEARDLAEQHGLESRAATLDELHERIESARSSLAIATTAAIGAYSFVLGIIAAIVTLRLQAWRRDLAESRYGNVVLVGEMLDA
jgi:vacuolar-type H+-ATPase subunit I/STV1